MALNSRVFGLQTATDFVVDTASVAMATITMKRLQSGPLEIDFESPPPDLNNSFCAGKLLMFFARPILFFSCVGLTFVLVCGTGSSAMAKAGKFYDKDGPPETSKPFTIREHTVLKVEKSCKAASRPYTVMGKRYYPMSGDHTYSQTGVASWYGKQFHGRKTAIGERYDMFAMTAAHPTMELPSYARVTNLSNGKSVIVRVNDRGPFLGGRIIDMSYAAAVKLGYHKAGTARVKVERITRRAIASGNYKTTPSGVALAITKSAEKQSRIQQAKTKTHVKRISEVIGNRETPYSETTSTTTATTVSD